MRSTVPGCQALVLPSLMPVLEAGQLTVPFPAGLGIPPGPSRRTRLQGCDLAGTGEQGSKGLLASSSPSLLTAQDLRFGVGP